MRHIPFVFPDEGHQGMTDLRIPMLRDVFDPACVRMAFTATPDYSDDAEDQLGTYFPELIEEMTVSEAFERELLAKPLSSIHEVDVDASTVTIRAGDYDEKKLGRLMAAAPVFQKGMDLRYAGENATAGALMTCSSIEQAEDLRDFLMAQRPAGTPEPTIIVGTTPGGAREAALNQFEAEPGHTLIVVGALLQGWDSERCKVLVDMSPSISWVRTKQKYFRPMTKSGEARARIYVLIPRGLDKTPLLPNDVFGKSIEQTYHAHDGAKMRGEEGRSGGTRRKTTEKTEDGDTTPIDVEHVVVKGRAIIENAEVPTLVATRNNDVRKVIESGLPIGTYIPGQGEFLATVFNHPLFTGTGKQLLRYLGAIKHDQYIALMQRLYPEAGANSLLNPNADIAGNDTFSSERDHAYMMAELHSGEKLPDGYADGYRALYGPDEPEPSPEEVLIEKEWMPYLIEALEKLNEDVDHDLRALYYANRYEADQSQAFIAREKNIPVNTQSILHDQLKEFVRAYMAESRTRATQKRRTSSAPFRMDAPLEYIPAQIPASAHNQWARFIAHRKIVYPEIREQLIANTRRTENMSQQEAEKIWPKKWEDSREYQNLHDPKIGKNTEVAFHAFHERTTPAKAEKNTTAPALFTEKTLAFWKLFLQHRRADYTHFRARKVALLQIYHPEYTNAEILERYPDDWENSLEYTYLTDPKNQETFALTLHRLFS